MTTPIEPTEEQKQAALDCVGDNITVDDGPIARLLAEREHKLREDLKAHAATNFGFAVTLDAELSAARARIADLEADASRLRAERHEWMDGCVELRGRERAHLAHIKALEGLLDEYRKRAHPADIHEIEAPVDVEGGEG
jgi:hypothetical protein